MKKLVLFSLLSGMTLWAQAQIMLPKVLTNHMVLQREKPVAVWGTASPGEKITVAFAGQNKSAVTSETGNWKLMLDPMKASAEPRKMIITGSNTIELDSVLVGEVWLCSGQSNMEYPLDRRLKRYTLPAHGEDLSAAELAAAPNPLIRFLYVEKKLGPVLATAGWKTCADTTLRYVSATAYFFAKQLTEKLQIPVGIISSSWGGTRVEEWTPAEAYRQSPLWKDTVAAKTVFKINGMIPGKKYESMLLPIIPYSLRGILWYQGESNCMARDTTTFVAKTKLMLDTWKKEWNDESLRFYFVQIAPYAYSKRKDKVAPGADLLPYYWEAQSRCLAFPHAGMAVTTDLVDDLKNIHPSYKWEVGRRLSLWALAKDYGQKNTVYSGPLYRSMKRKGNAIVLNFSETGSGLCSSDGQSLTWFSIAGADRTFFPATASIKDGKVWVSSPDVKEPVAVRFAWDESAMPNFCNKEKLPASPFRTDNW